MSDLTDIQTNIINDNNNNNKLSDNHTVISSYVFWRYEYTKDSDVNRQPFISSLDFSPTWSNYKNKGELQIYQINSTS